MAISPANIPLEFSGAPENSPITGINQNPNNLNAIAAPPLPAGRPEIAIVQPVDRKATSIAEGSKSLCKRLKAWVTELATIRPAGTTGQRVLKGVLRCLMGLGAAIIGIALTPVWLALAAVGLVILIVAGAATGIANWCDSEKYANIFAGIGVGGLAMILTPISGVAAGIIACGSGLATVFVAIKDAVDGPPQPSGPSEVANPV